MKTKLVLIVLLIVAQLSTPLIASAGYNSSSAESYLTSNADNPWSTMALSAIGANSIPSDYLKSIDGNNALDYSAPILAITALNQDPKTFGNKNYVEELKKYHTNGQIGEASTINDDIFGLLALISAGESANDPAITDAKNFILTHQQSNGGWGFATSGGSDSNMTAAAIVALIASGTSSSNQAVQNGYNYLKTAQNSDGGFTYDPVSPYGTDSDSSSTAWVIWALNAGGISASSWTKDGNSPVAYLESNQDSSGYFKYQSNTSEDSFSATTTAYAVIALSGKTLPINKVSSTSKFDFRIEGKNNTVCTGQAEGPTALDIVKNASKTCGFTYNIKSTTFGPYLNQINEDIAAGLVGWLYLVNNISPSTGASEYKLKSGDSVVWYYGDSNWKPTRLSLSPTEVNSGGSSTATLQYLNNGSWSALGDAKFLSGVSETTSGGDGKATISGPDGFYKVFGEKDGFIRSNGILLKIGAPSGNEVGLKANILKGDVEGETISFIVDTSSLDFGTVVSGKIASKNLSITNTGTVGIIIENIVQGDKVFVDNIFLDNGPWRDFEKQIGVSQSQVIASSLKIPANYSGTEGTKTGTITFWATGQ